MIGITHLVVSMLLKKGLFRANKKSKGVSNFVFPRLYKMRDKSIAKSLTKIIRDNLPENTTAKLKKSFSSRSVRKGGISELSMHPQIGHFKPLVRSGPSAGSAQD